MLCISRPSSRRTQAPGARGYSGQGRGRRPCPAPPDLVLGPGVAAPGRPAVHSPVPRTRGDGNPRGPSPGQARSGLGEPRRGRPHSPTPGSGRSAQRSELRAPSSASPAPARSNGGGGAARGPGKGSERLGSAAAPSSSRRRLPSCRSRGLGARGWVRACGRASALTQRPPGRTKECRAGREPPLGPCARPELGEGTGTGRGRAPRGPRSGGGRPEREGCGLRHPGRRPGREALRKEKGEAGTLETQRPPGVRGGAERVPARSVPRSPEGPEEVQGFVGMSPGGAGWWQRPEQGAPERWVGEGATKRGRDQKRARPRIKGARTQKEEEEVFGGAEAE